MKAVLALLLAAAADPAAPLREADLAMSRAIEARDADAFARHVDEEAVWSGPAGLLEGKAAVLARWARFTAPGGPRLAWAPTDAAVSASDDLGYTVGEARWESTGQDGKRTSGEGRYVTVWRRGRDGRWRAVFDMDRTAEAPPSDAARATVRSLTSSAGDLRAEVGTWSAPGGARGRWLSVLRRSAGGKLTPVVETAPRAER
ncbi:MAG TPA: nuclear transport factor 2 family protein [Anaeromyxobacteraceae bacterium]|nr:nuclear transport factor 2 family protein [Anaeromyxobacteraceae bacterium]